LGVILDPHSMRGGAASGGATCDFRGGEQQRDSGHVQQRAAAADGGLLHGYSFGFGLGNGARSWGVAGSISRTTISVGLTDSAV